MAAEMDIVEAEFWFFKLVGKMGLEKDWRTEAPREGWNPIREERGSRKMGE